MENLSRHVEEAALTVKEIEKAIAHVRKAIYKQMGVIDYLRSTIYDTLPRRLLDEVKFATKLEGKLVLKKNATEAIEETVEFDLNVFKNPLYEAIENDETYVFSSEPGSIKGINIDLDKTAGTLKDYAAGVLSARQNTSMTMGAESASRFWALFIYGSEREGKKFYTTYGAGGPREHKYDRTPRLQKLYKEIIRHRVLNSNGKLAPWWRILNNGTGQTLKSNRGGTPWPNYGPTNFVEKSEKEIRKYYRELYDNTLTNLNSEIYSEMYNARKYLEELRAELDRLLKLDLAKIEIAKQYVASHLSKWYRTERLENVTKDMIERVAKRIVVGQAVRIRLGPNVRIRTTQIFEDYNKRLKELIGV